MTTDKNKLIGTEEEAKEMTFVEHLDEFRKHLIRSIIAIFINSCGRQAIKRACSYFDLWKV